MTKVELLRCLERYDVTNELDRVWLTLHVPPSALTAVVYKLGAYLMQQEKLHINGNTVMSLDIRFHPASGKFEIIVANL